MSAISPSEPAPGGGAQMCAIFAHNSMIPKSIPVLFFAFLAPRSLIFPQVRGQRAPVALGHAPAMRFANCHRKRMELIEQLRLVRLGIP